METTIKYLICGIATILATNYIIPVIYLMLILNLFLLITQ
nr:MAG TPA: hypothetical protein [Crassvirales sp.]